MVLGTVCDNAEPNLTPSTAPADKDSLLGDSQQPAGTQVVLSVSISH